MNEQQYFRMRAIVLARESGETWAAIGKRHKISGQRAQRIYSAYTWPTDVMERQLEEWRQQFEVRA